MNKAKLLIQSLIGVYREAIRYNKVEFLAGAVAGVLLVTTLYNPVLLALKNPDYVEPYLGALLLSIPLAAILSTLCGLAIMRYKFGREGMEEMWSEMEDYEVET